MSMDLPVIEITVVTLLHNHKKYIDKFVLSVKDSEYPVNEIIIIDNNSTDGGADYLAQKYPEVKLIRSAVNLGVEAGLNKIFQQTKTEFACILGPDVAVEKGWLLPLVNTITSDKSIMGCCSTVIDMDDDNRLTEAGASIHFIGHMVVKDHKTATKDTLAAFPQEMTVVGSTSLLINLYHLHEIGGFDDDIFLYYDEMDLCLRAKIMRNFRFFYVPDSLVHHGHGTPKSSFHGIGVFPKLRAFMMVKNRILVILKCYQVRTIILALPAFIIFELATLVFVFQNRVFAEYIKGILWNVVNLKTTIQKRKIIQVNRKLKDSQLLEADALTFNPSLYRNNISRFAQQCLDSFLGVYWRCIRPFV